MRRMTKSEHHKWALTNLRYLLEEPKTFVDLLKLYAITDRQGAFSNARAARYLRDIADRLEPE